MPPPTQHLSQQQGKQKILVNATHPEEMRIAIIFGADLFDLEIEQRNVGHQQQNNIYKGRVAHINSSLNAAFVDFGAERDGFLPLKHLAAEFYPPTGSTHADTHEIAQLLHEGQEIIVQVDKEERDGKGAALTTLIRLPGRSLVLSPNDPRSHGVSRRLSPSAREAAQQLLQSLEVPAGMSVVLRSSAANIGVEQLHRELQALARQWSAITAAAAQSPAPHLLLREDDVLVRVLRDWLSADTDQVLLDTAEALERAQRYVRIVSPEYENRLQLYEGTRPLFNRYHVERHIASAYQRMVPLPAGGDIVIDRTEAMTVIDVNSSSTKGKGIEEVALTANLEAVEEISRQLRLRDIGGLIVIDFIDMNSDQNRHAVENSMETALANDRTRINCGHISRFGLLEMTRKRLRPSLREQRDILCPRCDGNGSIRPPKQQALDLLRLIVEESASRPKACQLHVLAPIETAAIFYNDYRDKLSQLEQEFSLRIQLFPDPNCFRPHHRFYGENDDIPMDEAVLGHPDTEHRLQHRAAQQRAADQPLNTATVSSEQAWAPVPTARLGWWRQWLTGLRSWLQSSGATMPTQIPDGAAPPPVTRPQTSGRATSRRSRSDTRRRSTRNTQRQPREQRAEGARAPHATTRARTPAYEEMGTSLPPTPQQAEHKRASATEASITPSQRVPSGRPQSARAANDRPQLTSDTIQQSPSTTMPPVPDPQPQKSALAPPSAPPAVPVADDGLQQPMAASAPPQSPEVPPATPLPQATSIAPVRAANDPRNV